MPGLLARMFGRGRIEERRNPFLSSLSWGQFSGGTVSAREAEALSTVASCVELIAGAFSSLPASLVLEDGSPAPAGLSAWRVLRRPNRYQSWASFASWSAASLLLHGNSLAWIQTDARGGIVNLVPVAWQWINPMVIAGAGDQRLVYDVVQSGAETSAWSLPKRLLDSDCLHARARSDHGLIGRSVLSRAAGALHEATAIQTLADATWRNGARPSMALTAPSYLNEVQRARKQEFIDAISGAFNSGKVAVLEGNWKIDQLSMNSVDAEFLSTRKFSKDELCNLFGVPSLMLSLGERVPNDLPAVTAMFAQTAVLPLVTAFEHEFSYSCLPSGVYLRLDMDAMMRGSFSAVTAAICAAAQSGLLTINDGRSALGWGPVEGGDRFVRGPSPDYPADFTGGTSLAPKPGANDGRPSMPSHGNTGSKGNGKVMLQ